MTKLDISIAIIINLLLGSTFAFSKYIMDVFSPVFVYSMRFFLSGALFTPFVLKKIKYDRRNFNWIFIVATSQAISLIFLSIGLSKLESSISAILNRVDIPLAIILGSIVYKEKIYWNTVFGIFICFLAIYILQGGIDISNIKYLFIGLCCPIFMATSDMFSQEITMESKLKTPVINLIVGVELLLFSLAFETILKVPIGEIGSKNYMTLLYLAIFPTQLSYIGLYYLMRKYKTSLVMPYNFVRPIFSVLLGFIILGESITARKIIGVTLILSGVFISQYFKGKKEPQS
jgi:drug/metabolite transporter (DMT)-like permease